MRPFKVISSCPATADAWSCRSCEKRLIVCLGSDHLMCSSSEAWCAHNLLIISPLC